MIWILLACTVGSSGPATPGSHSADASENMNSVTQAAGELSNAARELETASIEARKRIGAGADPKPEAQRIQEMMTAIEALEEQLQTHQAELEKQISAVQSTDETRE
jgi:hypothetical protein